MFKHVEHMRKKAFEICNRAYGGRTKEGETIYDSYPLKRWELILCYEDIDEARNACKHYGITVKRKPYKSSSGATREEEFILWKHSSFREPKDPDKGVTIPLKPKKMIKTIERKLNGATRLAVCRGAVSGEGSVLSETSCPPRIESDQTAMKEKETELLLQIQKEELVKSREKQKAEILLQQQREDEALRKRQEEEREKQMEREKAEQHAARLREELQVERRRRAEEELKKNAEKEEWLRQEREKEAMRKKEEERLKAEAIKEKERLARIEEERRIEAEKRRLLEEQQRLAAMEAERLRVEAERKRKEEERKRRDIEERRRRRERELEEQRAMKTHSEWKEKTNAARKEIFFKRMVNKIPLRLMVAEKTGQSLKLIDERPSENRELLWIGNTQLMQPPHGKGIRRTVESLISLQKSIDVDSILGKVALDSIKSFSSYRSEGSGEKLTFILTISVQIISDKDHSMRDLVRKWIDFNFQFRNVFTSKNQTLEIRLVLVDATEKKIEHLPGAAIFVLPSSMPSKKSMIDIASLIHDASDVLLADVPRIALVLSDEDGVDSTESCVVESKHFPPVYIEKVSSNSPDTLLSGLQTSLETALQEITLESAVVLSRVSINRLCFLCVNEIIWQNLSFEAQDDFLASAIRVLDCLTEEIELCSQTVNKKWPPVEFISDDEDKILDYFDKDLHLPANWHESLQRYAFEPKLKKVQHVFRGKLSVIIQKLLESAPDEIVNDCMSMFEQRLVRRCFQTALSWAIKADDSVLHNDEDCVYIPYGSLNELIEKAASRLREKTEKESETSKRVLRVLDESTWRRMSLTPENSKSEKIFAARAEQVLTHSHVESTEKIDTMLQVSPDKKRGRDGSDHSAAVANSKAFTKKLRAMVQGGLAKDIVVGHTTLSSLLRDAQNDIIPK